MSLLAGGLLKLTAQKHTQQCGSTATTPLVTWVSAALEHTTKTTANYQRDNSFCTCTSENISPCQWVAVVCICYSKREPVQLQTTDIQTVVVIKQCFDTTLGNIATCNRDIVPGPLLISFLSFLGCPISYI